MSRRRVLIVDGYNVIRNNARYRSLGADYEGGDGWNKARETLVTDVAAYAGHDYERCAVVFDAADNPSSKGEPAETAGVEVIFSPFGTSADSVIEKIAHDARMQGAEVIVVSSDSTIQSTVYGGGVTRMSARGFASAVDEEWRDGISPQTSKNTLAQRLDPETRERLNRLLDRNA